MRGKFTISSVEFHYSHILTNAVEIRDKMLVVYKEMARDGASNVQNGI